MKTKLFAWLFAIVFLPFMRGHAQTVQWAVRPSSAQLEGYGSLLKVRKNGKCGLIDHNNREVITAQYDSISPFRDGYALALNQKGNQLKIEAVISEADYEAQPLTEEVYATRYTWFSDGKMPVKGAEGWGYLGVDGNMVIPCQFQQAYPFSEGFASVMINDNAYFINRNMDYLSIEAGYGDLVFASTFSGGEAVVYSVNMKGYVINRRGRTLRPYKVKASDVRPNKIDHSIGDRAQNFREQVQQLSIDDQYTIYEENGLYGYKRGDQTVLPAQLEQASPVRGTYASVRFRGQDGVLRFVNGNFSTQLENDNISIEKGLPTEGFLMLNLPSALQDASVRLQMQNDQGKSFYIQPNTPQGEHRSFMFRPLESPSATRTDHCQLEVWNDNLLLWKNNFDINYTLKPEPIPEDKKQDTREAPNTKEKTPIRIASLSVSAPRASSKRANPKNEFYVTVSVSNSGEARGNATVTLSVDGQTIGNKNVSVRGRGTANAIFAVTGVKKERYAKVKATLKNGRSSHEANIHFIPFY